MVAGLESAQFPLKIKFGSEGGVKCASQDWRFGNIVTLFHCGWCPDLCWDVHLGISSCLSGLNKHLFCVLEGLLVFFFALFLVLFGLV